MIFLVAMACMIALALVSLLYFPGYHPLGSYLPRRLQRCGPAWAPAPSSSQLSFGEKPSSQVEDDVSKLSIRKSVKMKMRSTASVSMVTSPPSHQPLLLTYQGEQVVTVSSESSGSHFSSLMPSIISCWALGRGRPINCEVSIFFFSIGVPLRLAAWLKQ